MAISTVKATINGQQYTLTWDSATSKHKATITAPSTSSYNQSGHYYDVQVQATDVAGNVTTKDSSDGTLGASLQLTVKEKVAPVISLTNPTNGATLINNKPTITWTVTDLDSGVATATIKIDGGTTQTVTGSPITNGYSYSYTPSVALADGSHTIYLNATDNDGNAATQVSASIKIDTVPPVLNISSPADALVTNQTSVTVSGVTNDATSSPVSVTVNGTATTVDVGGNFSKTVNLVEGSNTITVVATDAAGKSTTITRTVTRDTVAPTFSSVTITPNPVDCGATFIISVGVSD
jgi:hypothetical protein